jgi:hypothetical protein
MLRDTDVEFHRDRLDLGENSSSCVSFLRFRTVPVLLISVRDLSVEAPFHDFLFISLDFIEAHYVWIRFFHELLQMTLVQYRLETIDVPMPYMDLIIEKLSMLSISVELLLDLQTKEAC